MRLENSVALVTGASRGIGASVGRMLAGYGAAVGVNYFSNRDAAEAVVADIAATGGRAIAVQGDSRDPDAMTAAAREVESALGPIDILVINAAMAFPTRPFLDIGWADFEAKVTGEVASAFHVCKAVAPGMAARRHGSIIAISSTLSRQPAPGYSAHTTAKSGLDGFVKSLALELGPHGVRANIVAPGITDTDATAHIPGDVKAAMAEHIPLRRRGTPDDIARVVAFLASDASGYLTGAYLPANGGNLML
ncbi:SDR family oxidoreductase [Pleomorphomonas carboxyditropha]|uniref:Short-chain dehydrogenase n=1 Tax=Pleomorphomonas carboxyditropha TaxID=2023338 RepID=A0A2G9WP53_9HYPH|nr:SDR family oxidoreductase [Pleomorphomonas carboxyditropha]PIO96444.1 short-chain dehydrogenase [Pleomorphomonas carboxyditropha]